MSHEPPLDDRILDDPASGGHVPESDQQPTAGAIPTTPSMGKESVDVDVKEQDDVGGDVQQCDEDTAGDPWIDISAGAGEDDSGDPFKSDVIRPWQRPVQQPVVRVSKKPFVLVPTGHGKQANKQAKQAPAAWEMAAAARAHALRDFRWATQSPSASLMDPSRTADGPGRRSLDPRLAVLGGTGLILMFLVVQLTWGLVTREPQAEPPVMLTAADHDITPTRLPTRVPPNTSTTTSSSHLTSSTAAVSLPDEDVPALLPTRAAPADGVAADADAAAHVAAAHVAANQDSADQDTADQVTTDQDTADQDTADQRFSRERYSVRRPMSDLPGGEPSWDERALTLAATERAIDRVDRQLRRLSQALTTSALPSRQSVDIFDPRVGVTEIVQAPPQESVRRASPLPLVRMEWPTDGLHQTKDRESLQIWQPFLQTTSRCTHARFRVVQGKLDRENHTLLTSVAFDGTFEASTGEQLGASAAIVCRWRYANDVGKSPERRWTIYDWRTKKLEYWVAPHPLFTEVLDHALAHDAADLARARHSSHERFLHEAYATGKVLLRDARYVPFFVHTSYEHHPGISVVDVDGDGWDDLYVTMRWARNLLFRNLGDGTFEEVGGSIGLNIIGASSCSLFADFDNDGDMDVFVGRTLERSQLLMQENGRFVDRSANSAASSLPFLVTSASAADYNGDGLLDLYLCTYGLNEEDVPFSRWSTAFLSAEEQQTMRRFRSESNRASRFVDRVGPPNVLLVNRGAGRFERARGADPIVAWRDSVQSTWSDFDQDGDPDLYVANDGAPDGLYRNDGAAGFTNIAHQIHGGAPSGMATGACWGDFDNDGAMDLYVSNMFSIAAARITPQLPELDDRFARLGRGNQLYRFDNDTFRPVGGGEPNQLPVVPMEWTWGSQFLDVDNDGFLDIVAPAGYFTPPAPVASGDELSSRFWLFLTRHDMQLPSVFRDHLVWGVTETDRQRMPLYERFNTDRMVARDGPTLRAHAYADRQPDQLLLSQQGKSFVNVSTISGMASVADGRSCAHLDFDRDGWNDLAVVSANRPLLQLFRNTMGDPASDPVGDQVGDPAASSIDADQLVQRAGVIAVRLVGGNHTSKANTDWTNRDGYGARVQVELQGTTITRELRAGSGFAAQNSNTLIIGLSDQPMVHRLRVTWPTGIRQALTNIPAGYLVTVYENPAQSPNQHAFTAARYGGDVKTARPPESTESP